MASLTPNSSNMSQRQDIFRRFGLDVNLGGGRGQAALAYATPQQRQAIQAEMQRAGFTNFALPKRAQPDYNGGVVPVGQVEPFHTYERQALTSMGSGQAPEFGFFSRYGGYMDKAGGLYDEASRDMTDSQFNALYKRYNDPYVSDVIDQSTADLRRQADIERARLMPRFAGSNSFGSTAQGVAEGQVADSLLNRTGQLTSNLRSSGYQSAVNNARGDFESGRNARLAAARGYGSLGNQALEAEKFALDRFRTGRSDQLAAGGAIRNQNQRMLDIVRQGMERKRGYPQQQLTDYTNNLGIFGSGETRTYKTSPNTVSQLSGLGMYLAPGVAQYERGTDWQDSTGLASYLRRLFG